MSLIHTAQNVDLSNATVNHAAGNQSNQYNINIYSDVLNPTLNVRDSLVLEMPSRLTPSKEHTNRIQGTERLHDATGSRSQVRPDHHQSWSRLSEFPGNECQIRCER
jgi:hypothetical protein